MNYKKQYTKPEAIVVHFETEDVMKVSGGGIELPDHEWFSLRSDDANTTSAFKL